MRSHLPRTRFNDSNEEVDLTPMLDVVFILLIFFVVTAVFIKEQGVEVSRPSGLIDDPLDEGLPLVVHLDSAGKAWLHGEYVAPFALRARMKAYHARWPNVGAIIMADPVVDMGSFTHALDSARQVFRHEAIVLDVSS